MTRLSALKLSLILASSWSVCAIAQDAPQEPQTDDGAAIIVTGTRAVGMQAADSAAPVQVFSQEALSHVGQPNLNQALTQMVPSFTAQTQGTDMSNFSLSARLRGLSPNHTLVMVNGKRRHGSAILQVIAGPFQGSAAPSIDLIPPDAVSRIEVLQDGAAAVYGTDAIAGAINLILKDQSEGGTFKVTGGQYYNSEGELFSASGNVGFKLGEDGYFNLTAFHRRQSYTSTGTGQVTMADIDGNPYVNMAGTYPGQFGSTNNYYDPAWAGLDLNGINGGQAKSQLNLLFYNMGYDFGGVELYSFGDVSRRVGYAKQGYRPPNRICASATDLSTCFGDTGTFGMVPQQKVEQKEYSFTVGAKGEFGEGWNYDLSTTYGYDQNKIWTIESAHRALWIESYQSSLLPGSTVTPNTVTDAYDGGFKLSQLTNTLDIRKEFDVGMAAPLTLAFGGEYRRDTYEIVAGDFAATYKEGVQSFPGYKDVDAGKHSRSSKAGYINLIATPVDGWTVDLAGRYEDYSDFGDTKIGKITTRYDFSDAFAIRGTASTGFRAPTLAESFYSTVNVGPTSAVLQLPAGSPAAMLLGFNALKPEKSTNFSAGIVLRPIPRLAITIDGYYIKIKNRISATASLPAIQGGLPVAGAEDILAAIASTGLVLDTGLQTLGVASFTNLIDTETYGIDFAARYPIALDFGKLDLSLTANYNKTKITDNKNPTLFSTVSESYIEDASPEYKVVAGVNFSSGPFSANLRQTFYGKTSVLVRSALSAAALNGQSQERDGVVKATGITDLEMGYDFTDNVTFSIGANNLFDKRPEKPKLLTGVTVLPGQSPYENGTTTWNSYYGHGAYGSAGGYYYARIDFKF
ncbi:MULTISPECIES: TonB-dependent receptor plug domain-containing protein [Sphingobium]|uniref:TonB-denpendent receptor n=1 Tax=Sphingobium cupriresistens LL01 TaxID=1420583 RepID=A0A0J7XWF2_9SPHN|nr:MULTISPECIES: TonB-dependent receptor [Sphingobium]KMS55907.1 TonB-denpendent receptor [Sphingobium cupriresistens LL01]MBJ7377244.1 TonB-dependent receptor [Sphingobium sp.]